MTDRPAPRFTGVDTYIDPQGRFNFRYPSDWHRFALRDNREGVMVSPEAENPQTWFSVWITDLKEKVVAEDLKLLRKSVNEGIQQLTDAQIEFSKDDALGNLVKFERIFTFKDGETTRKWRQWLMYVDHWLMVVTYQGATPEEYDHWYNMVNYSFAMFNLPEALWFAVDRDLTGQKKPVE